MILKQNVDLSKKTTFHVGGIAKNYYIPENISDMFKLLNVLKQGDFNIISGGSNILINDRKEYSNIVSMEKIDLDFVEKGNGFFYVGCSNRIQSVINKLNLFGYGGFEELYSLPAMFGGIVYMNAGIGSLEKPLVTIADFIESVKVINLSDNKIEYLNKSQCDFKYRHSIFHNNNYIILGAIIKTNKQELLVSKKRIDDRIKYSKKNQEWGRGCFGSCFSIFDRKLLKIISIFSIKRKGIYQSRINSNWLVNDGTGNYEKAIKIIDRAKKIHKLFHKPIKCEVIIWK